MGTETHRVIHERLQHGRIEARVELAPEYGGRDVKAGAYLALGEAVYELRDVVREMPCGGAPELVGCDQAGLDEQCGDQGRDERRRGAETCLGYVCELDARGVEVRYFGERSKQDGQLSALELHDERWSAQQNADDIGGGGGGEGDTYLVLLRVKVIISDDGDVEASTKCLF